MFKDTGSPGHFFPEEVPEQTAKVLGCFFGVSG
jgi:hypothetical protein